MRVLYVYMNSSKKPIPEWENKGRMRYYDITCINFKAYKHFYTLLILFTPLSIHSYLHLLTCILA